MPDSLFADGFAPSAVANDQGKKAAHRAGAARMRQPDRLQIAMHHCCIDELVPVDHPVRTVLAVAERMDLSAFEAPIKSREFTPGRSANDVVVMFALPSTSSGQVGCTPRSTTSPAVGSSLGSAAIIWHISGSAAGCR